MALIARDLWSGSADEPNPDDRSRPGNHNAPDRARHAFVIRSRLSRWIPTVIGLTQEMVDAKIAELRAELEATE
jgi:hypothetical protein